MTVKCRKCRCPKWKGDACVNPTCPTVLEWTPVLKSKTRPVTAMVKHGFHAEFTMRQPVKTR